RSMRKLYDSTDFASDVMKSLVAHYNQLEFPSIDSLIAFLAHVAKQKVIDEYRRQQTLKRNSKLERPLSGNDADSGQLPSDDPTASQVVQAKELQEQLVSRADETGRTIIELKLKGLTPSAIAEQT